MRMGTSELLVVLAVVIIIFGPTQFPRLARIAGQGVKKLRKAAQKRFCRMKKRNQETIFHEGNIHTP